MRHPFPFCYALIARCLPLTACPLLGQSTNVPLEHWAYRFIDRLETKGLFVSEDFSTRPYSREAFAGIIAQISMNLKRNENHFSEAESRLFEQLKGSFMKNWTR